jgi:hypothetical protein
MCTYSVLFQACLVVVLPYTGKDVRVLKPPAPSAEGDIMFQGLESSIQAVVETLRYIALLCLYVGFTAVMVSVFTIEHPEDVKLTPAISPAMQCVMNLAVQYFTLYLAIFIAITANQFFKVGAFLIPILEGGLKTVMFAPMLSMLFIACRMRALQLTKATDGTIPPTAGPQSWAQEGMFLSTWAVLIQVICAILLPIALGGKVVIDEEGNARPEPGKGQVVGVILSIIRYMCLFSMYVGVGSVMYATYTMTPEMLPPYAKKENLLPVAVPQPPSPTTPGTTTSGQPMTVSVPNPLA